MRRKTVPRLGGGDPASETRPQNRPIEKHVPLLHAKALTSGDAPGTFEAVFAVFGNEDSDGDIVEAGAFAASWARKMPKVVWSHDWMSVPVGVTLEVDQLDRQGVEKVVTTGLPEDVTGAAWAKARLLVDVAAGEDHPEARKVWAALKAVGGDGRAALDEFSWGGRVLSETIEQRDNQFPVWHLNEVDQTEWGPCVKGANPATALIAVKSMLAAGAIKSDEAREALGLGEPEAADEVAKNVLNTDDLTALRSLLGLPDDTSTADTLAALRVPAPMSTPSAEQMLRVVDVLLS